MFSKLFKINIKNIKYSYFQKLLFVVILFYLKYKKEDKL